MSDKAHGIVLIASGLVLSGLILRNGGLLSLSIPFLVYLAVGSILAPCSVALQARRTISRPSVDADEVVSVQLVVTNAGSRLDHLILEDPIGPHMRIVEGSPRRSLLLAPAGTAELAYSFRAPRGICSWHALRVTAADPFGLFCTTVDVPAPGTVLVHPRTQGTRTVALKPRSTLHTSGPIPVRLGGSGTDFLGVREFRLGDSLRRLNWRLAGRHPGRRFSNEYERQEIGNFGIILDTRQLTNAAGAERALLEHSVSAAASLSEALLREGNRVALLVFGTSMTALFPGYGKGQLGRIIAGLSRVAPSPSLPLGFLEYIPTRLFPARSQLILLSCVTARDLPTYTRLRSFGYDLLLISPDPVEYASSGLPGDRISYLAIRAARLERAGMLARLVTLGVRVLNWDVSEPLAPLLGHPAFRLETRRHQQGSAL